jgi:hypothetical protein
MSQNLLVKEFGGNVLMVTNGKQVFLTELMGKIVLTVLP